MTTEDNQRKKTEAATDALRIPQGLKVVRNKSLRLPPEVLDRFEGADSTERGRVYEVGLWLTDDPTPLWNLVEFYGGSLGGVFLGSSGDITINVNGKFYRGQSMVMVLISIIEELRTNDKPTGEI